MASGAQWGLASIVHGLASCRAARPSPCTPSNCHSPLPLCPCASDLQAPASTADQAAPESVAPAAPDGSSSGRLRWAVKSGGIDAAQLDYLLHLCPEEERPDVARYRQPDDRKRAVVSHLMQHAATVAALGVPTEEAHLRCTRHGKPYAAANVARPPHAPNWNFNVSHEVRRCSCRWLSNRGIGSRGAAPSRRPHCTPRGLHSPQLLLHSPLSLHARRRASTWCWLPSRWAWWAWTSPRRCARGGGGGSAT